MRTGPRGARRGRRGPEKFSYYIFYGRFLKPWCIQEGGIKIGIRESMMRRQLRDGGFSLLEIMIAMTVIAIALFAILSMVVNMMATQENMRELEIAKEAAATKMEEIKSHPMQLPPAMLPLGVTVNNNSVYNFYNLTANK